MITYLWLGSCYFFIINVGLSLLLMLIHVKTNCDNILINTHLEWLVINCLVAANGSRRLQFIGALISDHDIMIPDQEET